jgi:hypothetical protein
MARSALVTWSASASDDDPGSAGIVIVVLVVVVTVVGGSAAGGGDDGCAHAARTANANIVQFLACTRAELHNERRVMGRG